MGSAARDGSHWGRSVVCLYALLIPFQPVFTLPDGSPLRLAAAELVAPLVFLAALARPKRALPPVPMAIAGLIPVVALFSTLAAVYERDLSGYAVGKTAGLFYLVGFCFAVGRCLEPGDESAVLRALGAGALWSAAVGLVGFAFAHAGFPNSLVQGERLCSTMPGDPNIFGSLLAIGLLVTVADRRLTTTARAVRIAILGAALLAGGSRSGTIAAVVGLVACAFLRGRDPWVAAARVVYVVLAVAVAGALALLTEPGARMADALWEHVWRTFTVESRFALYVRAFEQFMEHPVRGLGIGGFNDLNAWSQLSHGGESEHFAVHNTYLWALVDMGAAGGTLLPGLICAGVWRAARAARRWPAPESAAVVAAGLLALAVFNLFIDGFYQRHFWLLMACALCMPAARRATSRPLVRERWRRQEALVWSEPT
jgi:O-antigen ligase